jgi:hypothetical protein
LETGHQVVHEHSLSTGVMGKDSGLATTPASEGGES